MDLFNTSATVTFVVTVVALIYAVYTFIDNKRNGKKATNDAEDDRLLKLREGTIIELDRKVREQLGLIEALQTQQRENTEAVQNLKGKNELLVSILQGRDENTQRFQSEGLEAIKQSKEIFELVKMIPSINKNIERLTEALEKHFDKIEKSALLVETKVETNKFERKE